MLKFIYKFHIIGETTLDELRWPPCRFGQIVMGVEIVESVKIYIATNRNVNVICPKCQAGRSLDLTNKKVPFLVKTTCNCGYKFAIKFEKRIHYRKNLKSVGLCSSTEDSADGNLIRIVDISQSGLAFIKDRGRHLRVGEDVRLEFVLGETKVNCVVTVASVLDSRIGAKFGGLDAHTQKVIGFYLMP